MLKIKEYILKNKQIVGMALLGLVATGGLVYFLTKKPKPQQKPTTTQNKLSTSNLSATSTTANNSSQQHDNEPQDQNQLKLTKIISRVRTLLQKTNDHITPQIISVIIQGQYQLSNPEVKQTIFEARKQRRSKLDDHLQYAKIITRHQFELETLQQKYLSTILAQFNIDKVTWSDANAEWQANTKQDDQGISDLIRQQEQKQLLSLRNPKTTPKPIRQILQILQHKIQTLQSLNPQQLGFHLATDQAVRYDMIETYITDILYKQYNVQPEDLQYSIEQLNKQDKQKVIQCQDRIGDLMDGLIQVDQEEEEKYH